MGGVVVELTPVVTLDSLDGEADLGGHLGKEVEGRKRLRLGTQGKSPRIVREIINHDQIVLAARNTRDWRGPQITMNKIKSMHCPRRRGRKRESNMATQLARMAEMLTRRPSAREMGTLAKLRQSAATGVTKPAVPGSGRCRGESSGHKEWSSRSMETRV
jgi:hypothetical protein